MNAVRNDNMLHGLRLSKGRVLPSMIALLLGKSARSLGLFAAAALLVQHSIVAVAFVMMLTAAALTVVLQKPFSSGKALQKPQLVRLVVHAALNSCHLLLLLGGLFLCDPIRAVLLADSSGPALVGIAGAVMYAGHTPAHKVRGAIASLGALLILLLWDDPTSGHAIAHVEEGDGLHQDYHTVRHNKYFGWLGMADRSVGLFTLLLAACLRVAHTAYARRLGTDIGGVKRVQALSNLFAVLLLVPLVLLHMVSSGDERAGGGGDGEEQSGWGSLSFLVHAAGAGLAMLVVDFYGERVALATLEPPVFSVVAFVVAFASAALLSFFHATHMIGYVTLVAVGLLLAGTRLLTVSKSQAASRGTLIGYAPDGLPLYTFSTPQFAPHSLLSSVRSILRTVWDNQDSRQIFLFLCINFAFMLVEFMYGIWTNSLGLISDAFHMLFDCTALMVGLYASIMSKWKVLSGFANGVFLVIVAWSVFSEAVHRVFHPPEISTDQLLLVSVGGLAVNLVGIFAFSHAHAAGHGHSHGGGGGGGGCSGGHGHSHGGASSAAASTPSTGGHGHAHGGLTDGNPHGGHGHSHGHGHSTTAFDDHHADAAIRIQKPSNANMQGVFLHILADTLGSVGVIVSSLLIEYFGLLVADPVCSLFISGLIFLSVIPLLKQSVGVLLLATPEGMEEDLQLALQSVKRIDGVLGYYEPHFWTHTGAQLMGSLRVVVRSGTAEQAVLKTVTGLLRQAGINQLTVQVETEVSYLQQAPGGASARSSDGMLSLLLSSPYEVDMLQDVKSV